MTITLIPQDPSTLLLEQISAVIRLGVADCTTITAPDNVPWTDPDTACPAGHYMVPAGYHLYVDREPEEIRTPALILTIPEQGKERSPGLDGFWLLTVEIHALCDRDQDVAAMEALMDRLIIVLTGPLTLDTAAISPPQARLSTAALHVHGTRRGDNFESPAAGKLDAMSGHPHRILTFSVICSAIAS